MLREPVAIGSWLALGAVSLLSARIDTRDRAVPAALLAALFFLSAAATRYWLRDTRSRWQILAFVVAATVIALEQRRRAGPAPGPLDWAAWVGCAAAGVMLVRWATEGSPI